MHATRCFFPYHVGASFEYSLTAASASPLHEVGYSLWPRVRQSFAEWRC
jgi:hypothetical protein